MTTSAEIEAFLLEYEDALGSYDAERSASLWGMPGTVLTDDFAGSLDSRAELVAALSQAHPYYRSLGLARVTHTLLEQAELTERITRVRLRWHFHDADGGLLTDSDYEYVLRRDDDGIHAYVGVSIDEQQKLAELAERLGIQPG
jgi:GAF domain-containing protein